VLVAPADSWKLVLAIALFGAVAGSAWSRPPRRSIPGGELRRLVLGALALYGVGLAASLTRHALLGVILFAGGITVSTLAAWLSRGIDPRGEHPRSDEPPDEPPPGAPQGGPHFDWPAFERELEDYARRARDPLQTG
jgi:hypothetical protein